MKRCLFIFILVIGSTLLSASDMEKFLRNGVKHHFNILCEKEITIINDQINLDDIGEHTYSINFVDSLNIDIIEFLANKRFLTCKKGDDIDFQVTLTDSLDFFAVRNKIHIYPLAMPNWEPPFIMYSLPNDDLNTFTEIYKRNKAVEVKGKNNLDDYKAFLSEKAYIISDHQLKAMIKAYESIKEWKEITDLQERDVIWSEKNNSIKFSFGKPKTLDGEKIVLIDSVTLEVVGRRHWPYGWELALEKQITSKRPTDPIIS